VHRIEAASRQANMLGEILGTADDRRYFPHRPTHGLGLIELRILEGGEADQAVSQRLRQISLGDENLIGQYQGAYSGESGPVIPV
jgi:hypothetical protein